MDILIKYILTVFTIVLLIVLSIVGYTVFKAWEFFGIDLIIIPLELWLVFHKD